MTFVVFPLRRGAGRGSIDTRVLLAPGPLPLHRSVDAFAVRPLTHIPLALQLLWPRPCSSPTRRPAHPARFPSRFTKQCRCSSDSVLFYVIKRYVVNFNPYYRLYYYICTLYTILVSFVWL